MYSNRDKRRKVNLQSSPLVDNINTESVSVAATGAPTEATVATGNPSSQLPPVTDVTREEQTVKLDEDTLLVTENDNVNVADD